MKRITVNTANIALIVAVLIWGSAFVATKVALEEMPVNSLIFYRFALALVFFIPVLGIVGFPKYEIRDHLTIAVSAVFEPFLYYIFETNGLRYTSASEASVIVALIPIVVVLVSSIKARVVPKKSSIFGVFFSFFGVFIIFFEGVSFSNLVDHHFYGNMMILFAVISSAFYMTLIGNLGSKYSPIHITCTQMFYGTLLLIPMCFHGDNCMIVNSITTKGLASLLFLAIFATNCAFLCYNYALSLVSSANAAVFINGVPVVTLIVASFFLNETLSRAKGLGCMIVVFSVWFTLFSNKSPIAVNSEG